MTKSLPEWDRVTILRWDRRMSEGQLTAESDRGLLVEDEDIDDAGNIVTTETFIPWNNVRLITELDDS